MLCLLWIAVVQAGVSSFGRVPFVRRDMQGFAMRSDSANRRAGSWDLPEAAAQDV